MFTVRCGDVSRRPTGSHNPSYHGPTTSRSLKVWQAAVDVSIAAHECVETFQRRHLFTYGNQIVRAAASIGSNVAEGASRKSPREFLQFLYIARGSGAELHTLFVIVGRLRLAKEKELAHASQLLESTGKMLTNLIKSVSRSL